MLTLLNTVAQKFYPCLSCLVYCLSRSPPLVLVLPCYHPLVGQHKMVCLKWIPFSETMHRGTGSRDIHLFLHDPNSWMDIIILVQNLLIEHPFAARFGQIFKAWRILVASLSNCKGPEGKLMYGVQGFGENAS